MIEPIDAYSIIEKNVVGNNPTKISVSAMFDCRDKFYFEFKIDRDGSGYENVYFVDKMSGKITKKHYLTAAIEGDLDKIEPIDISSFAKKAE